MSETHGATLSTSKVRSSAPSVRQHGSRRLDVSLTLTDTQLSGLPLVRKPSLTVSLWFASALPEKVTSYADAEPSTALTRSSIPAMGTSDRWSNRPTESALNCSTSSLKVTRQVTEAPRAGERDGVCRTIEINRGSVTSGP